MAESLQPVHRTRTRVSLYRGHSETWNTPTLAHRVE